MDSQRKTFWSNLARMALVADQIKTNGGALPPGVASVGVALRNVQELAIRNDTEKALVRLVDPAITSNRMKYSWMAEKGGSDRGTFKGLLRGGQFIN